jgi:IS4 transposase
MSHMETVGNLGVLNDANSPGCLLHVLKAFTPERLALGIVSAKFITRSHEDFGKKLNKASDAIEGKESYRWLEDYRRACDIAKNSTSHIVYIADREADIYELLYEANDRDDAADIIIRGNYNRKVLENEGATSFLLPTLQKSRPIGTLKFCMPAVKGKRRKNKQKRDQKGREGREVKQEIRSVEVTLPPPKHKKKRFSPTKIYALYLEEIDVPEGEESINWLLFTTLKIETQKDAEKVVDLYLCRWGIETFFHVLKTGCTIEELQFENSSRLFPCIAMYLIVAWRVMHTMMLGRLMPEVSCGLVFEEDEWECAYAIVIKKRPPSDPPTLGNMIRMIATMGGYLGRKNDGPPGPQVIWIGIQKLYANTEGWSAHKNLIASR